MINALEQYDPLIFELIRQESARQSGSIRLIPSENYVSGSVLEAMGSILTNKYSEGFPDAISIGKSLKESIYSYIFISLQTNIYFTVLILFN